MEECYFGGKSSAEIQRTINSTIVKLDDNDCSFEDVAGLQNLEDELSIFSYKLQEPFVGGSKSVHNMLLFGPHGVGKTMVMKALAKEANATFFDVSSSQLSADYPGRSAELVDKLMETASRRSPSIIFIKDAERLFLKQSDSKRDPGYGAGYQLRQYFDGRKTAGSGKVLIVCETNKPNDINHHYIEHFSDRFFVPLPDADARKEIFVSKMKNDWSSISDDKIDLLASMTEGYSGQDIHQVVEKAKENLEMKPMGATRSVWDCLKGAIRCCGKSVTSHELEKHQTFNELYGSEYLYSDYTPQFS